MKVKLADVCACESSNLKQSDVINISGKYPVYGATGKIGYIDTYKQEKPYIAIVKDGAGVGRTYLCDSKSSVIGTLQYILPKENVLPEYLFYVIKHMHLEKYYSGATIPHIYFKNYKNEEFNLDSINNQETIINILNDCNKLINLRETQLQKYDDLIKARFVEMFGDPVSNDKEWKQEPLRKLATKIGSGATPKGGKDTYRKEGISFIRSMNVHNGQFEYKDLAHISYEQATQLDNVTIEPNDVLLNITGASVARCCIVPTDILPARVNQHVCIVRCNDSIMAKFLNYLLIDNNCQNLLWNIAGGGATREAITKQQIENLQIILPSIELQQQFADFVQQVDKSKLAVQKSLEKTQLLFDSLMQEYFG